MYLHNEREASPLFVASRPLRSRNSKPISYSELSEHEEMSMVSLFSWPKESHVQFKRELCMLDPIFGADEGLMLYLSATISPSVDPFRRGLHPAIKNSETGFGPRLIGMSNRIVTFCTAHANTNPTGSCTNTYQRQVSFAVGVSPTLDFKITCVGQLQPHRMKRKSSPRLINLGLKLVNKRQAPSRDTGFRLSGSSDPKIQSKIVTATTAKNNSHTGSEADCSGHALERVSTVEGDKSKVLVHTEIYPSFQGQDGFCQCN